MTSQEIQRAILKTLATDDDLALNHFDIAQQIDQAPFRVRAELRELRRQRLVAERLNPLQHVWYLTSRGWDAYYEGLRLRLMETWS